MRKVKEVHSISGQAPWYQPFYDHPVHIYGMQILSPEGNLNYNRASTEELLLEFHMDASGHDTNDCWGLKHKMQVLIDNGTTAMAPPVT